MRPIPATDMALTAMAIMRFARGICSSEPHLASLSAVSLAICFYYYTFKNNSIISLLKAITAT